MDLGYDLFWHHDITILTLRRLHYFDHVLGRVNWVLQPCGDGGRWATGNGSMLLRSSVVDSAFPSPGLYLERSDDDLDNIDDHLWRGKRVNVRCGLLGEPERTDSRFGAWYCAGGWWWSWRGRDRDDIRRSPYFDRDGPGSTR